MKRIIIIPFLSIGIYLISYADQALIPFAPPNCTTIILQPDANNGKDCEVYSLLPDKNYVSNVLRGNAWTWSGTPGVERGLFQFDLSTIPVGSKIESAYLDLYSPNPPNSEFHSGTNATFLKRITTDWKETSVTWNNQPSTTDVNKITLATSSAPYQDYLHIDVTKLVKDMIDNPGNSFGFMIMQQVEQIYRRMTFCSSDYPDDSKHPRLVICYSVDNCTSLVLQPGAEGKDCEIFSLQPNLNYGSNLLRGNAWKFSGRTGFQRGLIQFDLSSIPQESEITSAKLSLYAPTPPSSEFHSGINGAYLQRIITNWEESKVTWYTQPITTVANQVMLPVSTNAYEDYINIDVTAIVQDMVDNPSSSFGFMLLLQRESILRRMSFCSSDYPEPGKHPKLEVCYVYHPRSIEPKTEIVPDVRISPNPCSDFVKIHLNPDSENTRLQILDFTGRIIFDQLINDQSSVDMSEFASSIYIFRIIDNNKDVIFTSKVVKQ